MTAIVLQCDYCKNLLVNVHNEPRGDVDRISRQCASGPAHDFCHATCYRKWREYVVTHRPCACGDNK